MARSADELKKDLAYLRVEIERQHALLGFNERTFANIRRSIENIESKLEPKGSS